MSIRLCSLSGARLTLRLLTMECAIGLIVRGALEMQLLLLRMK